MTVFNVAVVCCCRNHIAFAAFSAFFEVRDARAHLRDEYLYNRMKFYLVSVVAENVFLHIFRKKSTCHYLDFVI